MAKSTNITVKDAIRIAKKYVEDLYSEERVADVLLEEVRTDATSWLITIGFSNATRMATEDLGHVVDLEWQIRKLLLTRKFKVVRVHRKSGAVIEMTDRAA